MIVIHSSGILLSMKATEIKETEMTTTIIETETFSAEILDDNTGLVYIELWDDRKHTCFIRDYYPTMSQLKELANSVNIG